VDQGAEHLEGRRLSDRYVLEEELASGGMGGLWLARDEVLGRQVAVKVLHDRLAGDHALVERFRIEAVAAARLSHPAIVRVFDTGTSDGVSFIVMELVEGQTVAELLKEGGALSPAAAASIIRGVLQALAHAHREGVIHRDVRPGNILIGSADRVKLADFGIAKAAFNEADLTTTGNLLGTSRYLSPEQVTGGEVDQRSDLYSVGVVLYELLTGRPPFDAETHMATATIRLTANPAPPGSLRPGIPRGLEAIVMKALARDPNERFQTAEEMSAALERVAPDQGGTRSRPRKGVPPVEVRPHRPFLRSWFAIPLILTIVAALTVGAFLLLEGFATQEGPRRGEVVPPPAGLDIVGAYSYDPGGTGGEHDDSLAAAIDGNAATFWPTEGYNTPDLGGIKDGVGLVLELQDQAQVGGVHILTDLPGWEFAVYAGSAPDTLDLTAPLGNTAMVAQENGTYGIQPTETRYVLIWITNLVEADDGKYRALVNEVDLIPPGA
jgi:hypothetical protein